MYSSLCSRIEHHRHRFIVQKIHIAAETHTRPPNPKSCGDGRDELGRQEDPPLQRHHGPLHARLVGALPIQYPSICSSDLIPIPLQFVIKICWMSRRSSLCAVHHHLFFRFALRFGLGSSLIRSWGKVRYPV
jgi:hypothetical protein